MKVVSWRLEKEPNRHAFICGRVQDIAVASRLGLHGNVVLMRATQRSQHIRAIRSTESTECTPLNLVQWS
jgi:hypothetical protein